MKARVVTLGETAGHMMNLIEVADQLDLEQAATTARMTIQTLGSGAI